MLFFQYWDQLIASINVFQRAYSYEIGISLQIRVEGDTQPVVLMGVRR